MTAEILNMETVTGLTISAMAKELGITRHAVEIRLITAGIKPLTYEALYTLDTLEKIRGAKRGRPPKAKTAKK
jgi:plasmid maintenance system antidote protein VapI